MSHSRVTGVRITADGAVSLGAARKIFDELTFFTPFTSPNGVVPAVKWQEVTSTGDGFSTQDFGSGHVPIVEAGVSIPDGTTFDFMFDLDSDADALKFAGLTMQSARMSFPTAWRSTTPVIQVRVLDLNNTESPFWTPSDASLVYQYVPMEASYPLLRDYLILSDLGLKSISQYDDFPYQHETDEAWYGVDLDGSTPPGVLSASTAGSTTSGLRVAIYNDAGSLLASGTGSCAAAISDTGIYNVCVTDASNFTSFGSGFRINRTAVSSGTRPNWGGALAVGDQVNITYTGSGPSQFWTTFRGAHEVI